MTIVMRARVGSVRCTARRRQQNGRCAVMAAAPASARYKAGNQPIRAGLRRSYCPPSTAKDCPVTHAEAGLAR